MLILEIPIYREGRAIKSWYWMPKQALFKTRRPCMTMLPITDT